MTFKNLVQISFLDEFKKWHQSNIHEYTNICGCDRCTTITDYLLEEWRSGTITDELIGEWFVGRDWIYEPFQDCIEFVNRQTTSRAELSGECPEYGKIFLYAYTIGFREA